MFKEIWKPIAGYDGMYEVSSLGRVRSYHGNHQPRRVEPRVLVQGNLRGYRFVNLPRLDREGRYCPLVHRLVAEAFIGPPPTPEATVNHKDYDKANNRFGNLEWMSQADNVRHSKDVIPHARGEANHSKLTENQVIHMRTLYATGAVTYRQLGLAFGVSMQTAWLIVSRRKWKYLR